MHNVYIDYAEGGWRFELDDGPDGVVSRLAQVHGRVQDLLDAAGSEAEEGPERVLDVSFDPGGSDLAAGGERTQLVGLRGFIGDDEELVVTKVFDRENRFVEISMVTYCPEAHVDRIRVDRVELDWLITTLTTAARELDISARVRALGRRPTGPEFVEAVWGSTLRPVDGGRHE